MTMRETQAPTVWTRPSCNTHICLFCHQYLCACICVLYDPQAANWDAGIIK